VQIKFLTTGYGRVRFNPNLYMCGKVCLSLLGTWSGPSWDPETSTVLQVLVSLQAMVFCPDPYFNEPGFDSSRGSAKGDDASAEYNRTVRSNCAKHAIVAPLLEPSKSPHGVFRDVLDLHWKNKQAVILAQLEQHAVPESLLQQVLAFFVALAAFVWAACCEVAARGCNFSSSRTPQPL
jgi:hypothetical protein